MTKSKTQKLKGSALPSLPTVSQVLEAYTTADSLGEFMEWLTKHNCAFLADGVTANVYSFGDYVIKVIRPGARSRAWLLKQIPALDQIDPNSLIGCVYVQPILFSLDRCLCIQRKVKLPPAKLRKYGNETLPKQIYEIFADYVESSFEAFASMFDIHSNNIGYLGDRIVLFDGHERAAANCDGMALTCAEDLI